MGGFLLGGVLICVFQNHGTNPNLHPYGIPGTRYQIPPIDVTAVKWLEMPNTW